MLGQTNYPRVEDDHYPTPVRATLTFANHGHIRRCLNGKNIVEPAAGNGAIVKVLEPIFGRVAGIDIKAYEGDYTPDALQDFLQTTAEDLDRIYGARVRALVTNPPYGDLAEAFVRHALKLMEPRQGVVSVLCRHEWDCAKGRADIFDHPAFDNKLTMRFRPVWIEKKAGEKSASPRFSYAWFTWDFAKNPSDAPRCLYAG